MSEDSTRVPAVSQPVKKADEQVRSADLPLSAIEDAVRSIRFGTVQIIIQDGQIVQIEKTEKIRLR